MAYSYGDFEKAAQAAGLLGDFSRYDLDLARAYPEAGLSLLSLKQDWNKATTDEAKMLANEAANQIRSSYGGYTGGGDGDKYYAVQRAAATKPDTSALDAQIEGVLGQIGSYGSFSYADEDAYRRALQAVANAAPFSFEGTAPVYDNAYAEQQRQLLEKVLSRPEFSWDRETDPLWDSYKKSYLREGERATANALAQASAGSGGRASSAAINAATQAGDYYATKLNDMIPTLYQQALNRYMQEYQMQLGDLNAVNTQEQLDYARFLNELGQFNTDRGFALDTYATNAQQRAAALNALSADRNQAYSEYLNGYDMLQAYLGNLQGQSDTIYSRALAEEQQRLAAQQYADQLAQQQLENRMAIAQLGQNAGDYGGLAALGITPNRENIYADALAAAGRQTPVGGTTGGTVYTGGGGGKWDALESWVRQYGADSAEAYIEEHYKELGYSSASAAKAGWKNYQLENGGGDKIPDEYVAYVKGVYPGGVVTNAADWATLLNDYTQEQLNAAGISFSDEHEPTDDELENLEWDQASINALNRGPIGPAELDRLVRSGEVRMLVRSGRIYFQNTGISNAGISTDNWTQRVAQSLPAYMRQ